MSSHRKIIIIAGPNGAKKTTLALEHLALEAACPTLVNADLIATGLSSFQPDATFSGAGRLMLEEIKKYSAEAESFAFETTFPGSGYARRIRRWRTEGYSVKLISMYCSAIPVIETEPDFLPWESLMVTKAVFARIFRSE